MTLLGLAFFLITAFTVGRMRLLFSGFPAHEFEEATLRTACCLVLVEESQILFVELGEELIPSNLLKSILAAITREVDAQNAYFLIAPVPLTVAGLPPRASTHLLISSWSVVILVSPAMKHLLLLLSIAEASLCCLRT